MRVGSFSRFDRRPGCARVMVHPPAKEQLTSQLIDFTDGALVNIVVDTGVAFRNELQKSFLGAGTDRYPF